MSTSPETHENLVKPVAGFRERSAAAPRLAGQERHPFPLLPIGWAVIGRCRSGTGGPGPHATGCHALAHPEVGVALIDIAPNATPNAGARLRRALTAAAFGSDFPGTLPVLHDRMDPTALRSLPWVLEQGFAALPELTVPDGAAWIEGVRRAMAADPAWEVSGQPRAALPAPPVDADDYDVETDPEAGGPRRERARRWGRMAALPLAFVATFALGVVSGFVLLDSPTSGPQQTSAVAALPPQAPAAPHPLGETPRAATSAAETTAAAGAAPATSSSAPVGAARPTVEPAAAAAPAAGAPIVPAAAVPTPAAPSPPQPPPSVAEAAPPAPVAELPAAQNIQQAAGPAANGGPTAAPSPLETPVSLAAPVGDVLPMAPPRAPAPPVRVSAQQQQTARAAPIIDRACSQALFRFHQGERLTAAEQNFIRTGCGTARR